MTNAMLLNDEWATFLVDLPVDWLWFSIDGAFPETNDRFRKGSRLTVIEKNILNLIEKRERKGNGRPLLSFNMVAYPEIEDREIEIYVRRWLPYAVVVSISRFRPLGSRRLLSPEERTWIKPRPCPLLYRQMVIAWDGTVGLCCEDIHVEVPLGQIGGKTLLEIFNGKEARQARRYHESGRAKDLSLCRECDVWAADIVLKEEILRIEDLSVRKIYRPAGVLYEKL
ncbi:radical SAM/SPASM domain-containing protein [Thermosulfurimonas sp. F29]|uniref:radical SAM/SPASM domain-containing protein n=1 Tax=Thermosulfurimonas sp. F29 TaxID=2867247 RepID=UPI002102D7CC|nr:radical SAM/SPASM domain-containing protein [Thermosulfurimonas sp. F29]